MHTGQNGRRQLPHHKIDIRVASEEEIEREREKETARKKKLSIIARGKYIYFNVRQKLHENILWPQFRCKTLSAFPSRMVRMDRMDKKVVRNGSLRIARMPFNHIPYT